MNMYDVGYGGCLLGYVAARCFGLLQFKSRPAMPKITVLGSKNLLSDQPGYLCAISEHHRSH